MQKANLYLNKLNAYFLLYITSRIADKMCIRSAINLSLYSMSHNLKDIAVILTKLYNKIYVLGLFFTSANYIL